MSCHTQNSLATNINIFKGTRDLQVHAW
jgi:hypothetical protein